MAHAHSRIGYVHERPIFETRFSDRAYLSYLGELSGLWGQTNSIRVTELLEQVNLHEAASRASGTYSKGMLQWPTIAQALRNTSRLRDVECLSSGEATTYGVATDVEEEQYDCIKPRYAHANRAEGTDSHGAQ